MKFAKAPYTIKTDMLLPVRIVLAEKAENAEALLKETPRQSVIGTPHPAATIEPGGYIILDFGEEIHGGIVVTNNAYMDGDEGTARFVFGESVSEAMSSIGEKNATNDHIPRDFTYPIRRMSHMRVGTTGFRFVKIEAVDCRMMLGSVQAAYEHCGLPLLGNFKCDNERINRIWQTAVKTVYLCMQEFVWDGIKRDRLVWLGDMHPEISVILSAFGAADCVPRSLDIGRSDTNPWINGIPSYSMQWIRNHYLWYMQTGDLAYLEEQKEYMCDLISRFCQKITENGDMDFERYFVDWSSNKTPYEKAGFRAVAILALKEAAVLCRALNETENATLCENTVINLKKQCEPYEGNKQIAALCALAGLDSAEKIHENVLLPGGANGLSTFLGYYTLLAMDEVSTEDALSVMQEYWGAMLSFGATTFWEDFDIEWTKHAAPIDAPVPEGKDDIHGDFGKFCYTQLRHSLCHGWASGPAAYLAKKVLGIEVIEPGCKKVRIKPSLGKLTFAEGKYPTPYGEILVKHTTKDDKIETEISAPDEVEIVRE